MTTVELPRFVVAGAASGVGKTSVVVGLVRALARRGRRVAPFKCGPDYLDPTYHARAAGRASHNLDGWMMGRDAVLATAAAADADLAIVEGVMGLHDGASPVARDGSTAEIAAWLAAPVVLVVDVGGMARTAAAVVAGLAGFDPEVRVAGAIANRAGSAGHVELIDRALGPVPLLGGLVTDRALALPERHLGLRTADADAVPEALLDAWADRVAAAIDLDRLEAIARTAPPLPAPPTPAPDAPRRCRIAIARDAAFHFYYPDNLRRLEAAGAALVPFSPIADAALPDADAIYLGGGYPEVHAAALAGNAAMRASIAGFAGRGGPIYAECGGLLYLAEAIVDRDGARHPMAGVVPGVAVMHERLAALGYVEVETDAPTLLGPAGTRFRGHQFRYSTLEVPDTVARGYRLRRRRGGGVEREGYLVGNVVASYVHAHWASNPTIPARIVAAAVEARR